MENFLIKKPKVAILLCGYIRTWEKCLPSFLKFMSTVDYDIFIHTYTITKNFHPYIETIHNITNNMDQYTQSEIINRLGVPYKGLVIENELNFIDEVKQVENKNIDCYQWPNYSEYDDLQILKGKGISIRTYLQYRKFKLCNEMRKKYEVSNNVTYDFIIKSRMDLNYSEVSPSLLDLLYNTKTGKILTSSSNNQPNDHIYICLPEDIDKLLACMDIANLPSDREYNPHEYLSILLKTSRLLYDPSIHNLHVIRN